MTQTSSRYDAATAERAAPAQRLDPVGTWGAERKGRYEQVALAVFIAVPFVAILAAVPIAAVVGQSLVAVVV